MIISFNFPKLFRILLFFLFTYTHAILVTGKIVDEKNNPLNKVKLSLESNTLIEEIFNNNQGYFKFNIEKEDIYFINIEKLGFSHKTITINLHQQEQRNLNITLKKIKQLNSFQIQKKSLINTSQRESVSSTKINQGEIISMRIAKVEDLSALSANLFNMGTGSSFTSIFALRGMTSVNAFNPLVGMYIDGVAQFQSYNHPINLGNIESIEILKGPQTTLYGRNAMAGIIDIKTKAPPNRFSVSGSSEWFSSRNAGLGGQLYDLSFSIPLAKNKAYLKAGGYYQNTKGFFYNQTLKKTTGGSHNFNAFLRGDFLLSVLDFYYQIKYEQIREDAFPYNASKEKALANPFVLYNNKESIEKKDIIDTLFNFKIPLRFFDITSVWNYQYFKGSLAIDTDFSITDSYIDLNLTQHLVTEETKFVSTKESDRYFTWTIGNYFYFQNRNIQSESFLSQTTNLKINDLNLGVAFFASMTYPILSNLHWIFGMRIDYDYKNIKIDKKVSTTTSIMNQTPSSNKIKHYYNVSPKTAINFYFNSLNLIYLSFSRGTRVGGINAFTSQIDKLLYKPESSWHLELGYKTQFVPNYAGSLSIDFFYIYWLQQQVNVFLPTSDGVFDFGIINVGSSYNVGAEIEATLPIVWGFSTGGAYGFTRAVFLEDLESRGIKGNYQPYVPQHTISTFFQHQFNFEILSRRDSIVNRFDYKYISKKFYDPENNLKQDAFFLLNYTFNFRINGIITTFWIKNILDKNYLTFALPFGNSQLPSKLGDPRVFGGKISLIF